jgi:hypothetical protein
MKNYEAIVEKHLESLKKRNPKSFETKTKILMSPKFYSDFCNYALIRETFRPDFKTTKESEKAYRKEFNLHKGDKVGYFIKSICTTSGIFSIERNAKQRVNLKVV